MPSPLNDDVQTLPALSGPCFVEKASLRRFLVPAPKQWRHDDPPLASWRRRAADAAYLGLVTSGWMFFNMLGALGCAVAFFIVLSAGQWDAFFLQLDNLTSRYVAADVSRRFMFEHYLVQGFMVLFAVITVLRAPSFIRRVRHELSQGPVR